MSQNAKNTEYTVISKTDIPNKKRVAVFKDSEIEQLQDYLKTEIYRCMEQWELPLIITRETTTKNFHAKVGGFVKQNKTRLRRIEIWDERNRGLSDWLKYPRKRTSH